ncbi:hypothetical protein [Halobacterium zhouii]|uniref:hypothetical protein n=1 Tax=Halobacterium zhouii TaxID=2902624 RepID=UPI001E634ABC|nr:hypothetical protein [Halobacterium zhouii]
MRWHGIALFVVVALAAVAIVPGLSTDGDLGVTYQVRGEEGDTVRVTATFHVPNATVRVRLPSNATVLSARNLEDADGKFDYRLDGPSIATLVYTVSVHDPRSSYAGQNVAVTDSWAMFRRHRVEPEYATTSEDWSVTERYADGWSGVAGADIAYWGPHERYDRRVAGQRITLVVPEAVEVSPDRILDALEASATGLRVGARDDHVTVFVAPDPIRRGGLTSGWETEHAQDLWVHGMSSLSTANDVWVHEYVHTRQNWTATNRMAWFREASAEYYGALFAYRQGRVSFDSFQTYLRNVGPTGNATIDAPATWRTTDVPYEKGAMVAAALDARIRLASDGERSLQWVIARMNDHEGAVTVADFRRLVEEAAGRSFDDWFERYVNGTALPTMPTKPVAYASIPTNESLGPAPGNASTDASGLT